MPANHDHYIDLSTMVTLKWWCYRFIDDGKLEILLMQLSSCSAVCIFKAWFRPAHAQSAWCIEDWKGMSAGPIGLIGSANTTCSHERENLKILIMMWSHRCQNESAIMHTMQILKVVYINVALYELYVRIKSTWAELLDWIKLKIEFGPQCLLC